MLLTDHQSTANPKFYGRRQGRRVRKAKTTLLDAFLPQLKINAQQQFSPQEIFPFTPRQIWLEIGFGNGEHLAGQALKNPDVGFIGAEVFKNGVANLLSLITGIKEGDNLPAQINLLPERRDNIRIFDNDVRLLFKNLPDSCLDRVFVLFPDPWPKKRHASRRFINQNNLNEISRILKKGGMLRIATDHPIYKTWALRQTHENTAFRWMASCGNDWKHAPVDWVETKYQRKALREGRRPIFLDFENLKS